MDESDFIRAIADDPDDAGAWLVYADWLQEQGDPRGEYLSLSIEFEQCDPDDRGLRTELLEGLKRLELAHGDLSGMGHARSLVAETCFGLVTAVRGPAGKLLLHDADLLRHPVETAHVQSVGEFATELARSALVGRVRRLTLHLSFGHHESFSEKRLSEAAAILAFLEELGRGPRLATTSLQLTNFDLEADMFDAVGRLPCQLRSLTLGGCRFRLERLDSFIEHEAVRDLESLDLTSHWGGPVEGGPEHLRCLRRLTSFREITVSGTDLLVEAVRDELPGITVVP